MVTETTTSIDLQKNQAVPTCNNDDSTPSQQILRQRQSGVTSTTKYAWTARLHLQLGTRQGQTRK